MALYYANPQAQYMRYQSQIKSAIEHVLKSGHYILGPEVQAFESEFSGYHQTNHGIGVGSGTDALVIALLALGIRNGDEIITVAHTAVATVSAIIQAGAKPVLVDIEPEYYNIDPVLIEAKISSRTKAIIPVHIYGQCADLDAVLNIAKRYKLAVIEDCAQAHGAKYKGKRVGSFGDAGCFSFYPTKNLGTIGDGGIIVTNNEQLAKECRLLREYGWKDRYISLSHGINSRLDELHAAILRVKLELLEQDNCKRNSIAQWYREGLSASLVQVPKERRDSEHVFHIYAINCLDKSRERIKQQLERNEVYPGIHYPMPIHKQPGYRQKVVLPVTERVSRNILSLPMYPELTIEDIKYICGLINGQIYF